ncbi:MAG: hypothetical protein WC329_01645 [Candidatus Omnitrophota bacterium]|jgi:hypothetical protein
MVISANTYAEHEDIEKLIGDIVPEREFNVDTVPTLAQVESELDDAAAELNNALDVAGYTVPVSSTDYPTAFAFLKAANAHGAAAVILASVPANGYNPDEEVEQIGETRATVYSIKFKSALKTIREHRIRAGMREDRLANIYAGSAQDADGNEKKPIFTRGMGQYPGNTTNVNSSDEDDDD